MQTFTRPTGGFAAVVAKLTNKKLSSMRKTCGSRHANVADTAA